MPFVFSRSARAAAALLPVLCLPSWAQTDAMQPSVQVSATRIDMLDTEAPYASEVHTRQDIARSGAHTLFDYLAQQSSLQLTPSYGNRNAPNISMRGFGEDGHQNVVFTINGRRLNNIDNVPPLIGSIALSDIERIEITKGSGAVMFGDGATAGSIQIYTKARDQASLDTYAGNYGQRGAVASVGMVKDKFDLSVTADHGKSGGFSDADATGHTDHSEANTWRIASNIQPIAGLSFEVEAGASQMDNRFPNALTPAQFEAHPGMSNGSAYQHQKSSSQHWSLGAEYAWNPRWKLSARHTDTSKTTAFLNYGSSSDYQHRSNEVALQYQHGAWVVNAGVQNFEGERLSMGSRTRKANVGGFVQAQRMWEQLTISAGLRHEQVRYRHASPGAAALAQDTSMASWELGANQRLSPNLTVFANYSDAFVTPDIDRFFDFYSNTFNGFIAPAKSRTLTLGGNHNTENNRLKLSVFYSKLRNEIYLEPATYLNTNIDQSHKYGVEVHDQWQVSKRHQLSVNYAWTRAKIDRERGAFVDYSGKHVPGVPQHAITLGWHLRVAEQGALHVSHTWRSSTWAFGNFSNDPAFKQSVYQSTDVSYRHQIQPHIALYAGVSNLLDRSNSVAVHTGRYGLYPVNFERTWKVGARIDF